MVLSTRNSGKYLTKEWNDPNGNRQKCLYDYRRFSQSDREYYEVTGAGIYDGLGYQIDDANTVQTTPVDTKTRSRTIDRRDIIPEVR
ncbi:MAG TPA: hypothetical protein PLN56_09715 [Methanoregulaceae archaeon]|nr:hypothetical protein [Methanoregulaceae archaeon]